MRHANYFLSILLLDMDLLQLHQFNLLTFVSSTNNQSEITGQLLLPQLPRIIAEKADHTPAEQPIIWRLSCVAQNQAHYQQNPIIELHLHAEIWLICQRCLHPYLQPLSAQHHFEIVQSEAEADAAPMDDDKKDAIVGSETFDLLNLIEDELLLALPFIPRHTDCHHPTLEQVKKDFLATEEKSISPFAKLSALKTKKHIH